MYGYNELSMIRDREQEDKYLVIEGTREGYGIDQVEKQTMTVGELIELLQQYDEDTKVVIGNDLRGGSFYTYGSISEQSIYDVEIEEDEDIEDEE